MNFSWCTYIAPMFLPGHSYGQVIRRSQIVDSHICISLAVFGVVEGVGSEEVVRVVFVTTARTDPLGSIPH